MLARNKSRVQADVFWCVSRFLVNVKFLKRGKWEMNVLIFLMVVHLARQPPLSYVVEQIRLGVLSNYGFECSLMTV
jgi:uncharacterized membrane protein